MPNAARRISTDGHIIYRPINAALTTDAYQILVQAKAEIGAKSYAETIQYALNKTFPHLAETNQESTNHG